MVQAARTESEQRSGRRYEELVREARALRSRYLEHAAGGANDDASPQAFYERSIARDDIREILNRLATH